MVEVVVVTWDDVYVAMEKPLLCVVFLTVVVLIRVDYLDVDCAALRLSRDLQHVGHILGAEGDIEELSTLQVAVSLHFSFGYQDYVSVRG